MGRRGFRPVLGMLLIVVSLMISGCENKEEPDNASIDFIIRSAQLVPGALDNRAHAVGCSRWGTLAINGDTGYMMCNYRDDSEGRLHGSVKILDLSNPASPEAVGTMNLPAVVKDVKYRDNKLYISYSYVLSDHIGVYSTTDNPVTPVLTHTIDAKHKSFEIGNYLYLLENGAFSVRDINNSFSLKDSFDNWDISYGMALKGNYAYLSTYISSSNMYMFQSINIGDVENLKVDANYTSGISPSGLVASLKPQFHNTSLYIPTPYAPYIEVATINPWFPQTLMYSQKIELAKHSKGTSYIFGNNLIVPEGAASFALQSGMSLSGNTLEFFDISNDLNATKSLTLELGDTIYSVTLVENYLYISAHSGLFIYKVSDGTELEEHTIAENNTSTENVAPIPNAGEDAIVSIDKNVTLDGTMSTDPNGDRVIHTWRVIAKPLGSDANLSEMNVSMPWFIADREGNYTFGLVVSDGNLTSLEDNVSIQAVKPTSVITAQTATEIFTNGTVTLDANSSSDASGNTLAYTWSITTQPEGSSLTLTDASSAQISFTPIVAGTYTVQLSVNNGYTTTVSTKTITVTTPNTAPVADAGNDQNVTLGTPVLLDGNNSSDAENNPLTYVWSITSKPSESNATLTDANTSNAIFMTDTNGTYIVQLTVNDGELSNSDWVNITVTPPVIEEETTTTDNNVTATRAGSIQTGSVGEGEFTVSQAMSIALSSSNVFVGARDGLSAVNLSPIELNSTYSAMGIANAVAVNGNYAYVADDVEGTSFHLYTLNISNPASITMESNQTLGSLTTDLVVSGDYLYAATGDRLEIFNIRDTNATAPVSEGNYTAQGMSAYNLVIDGNYTYLTSYDGGLEIINITNPANPVKEGNYTNDDWAHDVAISGNYAYVSNNISGTLVLDISNKATPTLVTTIDTNDSMDAVAIDGDYLFITDTGAGILIYDVSTPASPLLVGTIVMGDNTANDMVARDGFLYTAENNGSMGVYELTYPSTQTPDATPTYTVSTLAGTYAYPTGAVVDSAGNLFVVNTGNWTISKITPNGTASVFAGSGTQESVDGVGTAASFDTINYIAKDSSDNLYVTQANTFAIRKITPEGNVTTFKTLTKLPTGIAIDSSGTLYVAVVGQNRVTMEIIQIPSDGNSETVWVGGTWGYADGVGTAAQFSRIAGLAMDGSGTLYVADTDNHRIRKITPDGNVTTLAGLTPSGATDGNSSVATFTYPEDVTVDSVGNVYVADTGNHKIRKITPAGEVSTIAGSGTAGSADGVGIEATFNAPRGIAIDSSGTLYLSDTSNDKIRKIVP